jgi:hypothetical protein
MFLLMNRWLFAQYAEGRFFMRAQQGRIGRRKRQSPGSPEVRWICWLAKVCWIAEERFSELFGDHMLGFLNSCSLIDLKNNLFPRLSFGLRNLGTTILMTSERFQKLGLSGSELFAGTSSKCEIAMNLVNFHSKTCQPTLAPDSDPNYLTPIILGLMLADSGT